MKSIYDITNCRLALRAVGLILGLAWLASGLRAENGTWTNASGGNWSGTANWEGGTIADGSSSVAKFDTLNISGTATVNIDGDYTVGSLFFSDTNSATLGSWRLAGSNTLTLAASAAPVVSVILDSAENATFAVPVASANGLAKQGTGTLVIASPVELDGTITVDTPNVAGNVIQVVRGGSVKGTVLTLGQLTQFQVNGGYVEFDSGNISTVNNPAKFILNSGTAKFLRGGIRTGTQDSNPVEIRVNGGEFFSDVVDVQRNTGNTNGGNTAAGFIITGGTLTVGKVFVASSNSWGNMTVSGGDTLITGTFAVGTGNNGSRGGALRVSAGRLTALEPEHGLIMMRNYNTLSYVTLVGGVTTLPKISFGSSDAITAGTGSIALSGSAALYIGAGGMVKNAPGVTTNITLTSGTLGADDSWSMAQGLTVTLPASNSAVIRAADEYGVAHDITINAMITGAGGFTKTGGGMLTLSATNNSFGGSITLSEGRLRVTGQVAGAASYMSIPVNTGLGGSGTISRSMNFTAGSELLVDVDAASGALKGLRVVGDVNLGATLKVTPILNEEDSISPGEFTVLETTGNIAGNPVITWNYYSAISPAEATFTKSADNKKIIARVVAPIPTTPVINSPLAVSGTAGFPFTYTIAGANYPRTFGATGLPAGLSVNTSTGVISGKTDYEGPVSITITAGNVAGTDSKTLTITFNAPPPATVVPVITSTLAVTGTVPEAFSYQITATKDPMLGYGKITNYDVIPLPAGLAIDHATGLISGTLLTTGTTEVTLKATNAAGTGTGILKIAGWAVPVITSSTYAEVMINEPFSYYITADNNPTSFDASNLPPDFGVDKATGHITGSGTALLITTSTIKATNPVGTAQKAIQIVIDIYQPRITSEQAIIIPLGQSVDYQTVATRNPTRYHATPVPAGFTFNENTGRLTGTPSAAGTLFVELVAENSHGMGLPATLKIVTYGPAAAGQLLWTGSANQTIATDGLREATWDKTTQNWKKGGSVTNYTDGQDVYIDDSSNTERILLDSGTYTPNSMILNVSGRTLTIQTSETSAFGVSGTAEMQIQGTGTVAIAAANNRTWAGVTRIQSGVYEIGANYTGQTGTPGNAGPLIFEGGSLLYRNTRSRASFASYIVVGAGVHALMDLRYAFAISSNLEGSGTLEVRNANQSGRFSFISENFSGALVLSGTGLAELPNTNAWDFAKNLSNLTLAIEDTVSMRSYTNSGGNTIYIGGLAGASPAAVLNGGANGPSGKPNTTFRIGRKNIDTTFAGSIGDWTLGATTLYNKAELVKEGTAMLTLSGSHNYIFPTTVSSGALRLTKTGRFASTEPTAYITVNSGAAFGGAGVVTPDVTFQGDTTLLVDIDPETGELEGLSVSGLVKFEGGALAIRPIVTGTNRIANGVYTALFSENDFVNKPLLQWSYPADPAINAQFEYVGNNRIQVTISGGMVPLPKINSGNRADGMVGQNFSYAIGAIGDPSSPTQFTVENLPPGLAFDAATGVISGIPTAAGVYDDRYAEQGQPAVLIHATNASGTTSMKLAVVIYPAGYAVAAPVISSPLEIAVVKSRQMRYQIVAANTPTRFTATGLPNGITINANGLISGVCEILGTYNVTITASNLAGTDTKELVLKVSLPPPVITSPYNATAIQGRPFTYQIEALNEPTGYRMSAFSETTDAAVVTGTKINYLTIDGTTGLISGICPNVATAGTDPLMVTGTIFADNDTGWWGRTVVFTINPPEPVVTSGTQFFGVVGVPFTYVVTASNMYAAYKPGYGVTNIPQGLTIDRTNGELTGTPLVAGEYSVAFVATNVTGAGAKSAHFTINAASALATLAGQAGTPGATDGPLASAKFKTPGGGAVGKDGSLYVADTGNNSIRKIAANGQVSTLATGLGQPSAVVANPEGTALYVADTASSTIKKIDTATGAVSTLALTGAPALNTPYGLVIDSNGNLYVTDAGNHLVRKIDPVTGTMTTVAGAGTPGIADGVGTAASFDMPHGLALSNDGKMLYVADTGNNTIRSIDLGGSASSGMQSMAASVLYNVSTVAGTPRAEGISDGVGPNARFNTPEGLAVDSSGVLYVADTGNNTIRSIDVKSRVVITLAGSPGENGNMDGNAANSLLNGPTGLSIDPDGEIYVFDSNNHTIRLLQTGPAIVTPPEDKHVSLNSTVTFSVVASGGPTPTYQWYKDELLLSGATQPTLTLNNVQLSDVAYYRVVATNPLGFRSARAYLSISDANPSNPTDVGAGGGGGSGGGGGGGAPSGWYLAALAFITLMYRFRRHGRTLFVLGIAVALSAGGAPDLAAQAVRSDNGTVTGRVLNKATGQYLSDAVVIVEGTTLRAVTDATGAYRLTNVPAGTVRVSASYAGLDDMSKEVTVVSDAAANADFDMTAQVYQLEKFVVAGEREGSSRALQEQRVAVTQKAVFAADSFGNVVDNNIGELMKNLPGITIDYDGEDASTMRIRGMDPEFASITLDGNDVASIGNSESRAFNLQTATLQNIEKIEINAAPTADQPASTMGGQINIVTKSALRQKGRRMNFTANMSLNTAELNFDKTPGGARTPDRKLQPGFNFSWSENFNQRFAFALDVGFTRKYRYSNDYTLPGGYTYDTFSLAATDNKLTPDTTGYVKSLKWRERGGSSEDRMISLNLDYEPWGQNHSFFLKMSYNDSRGLGAYDRSMQVNAGSQASGSNLYNMISPNGVTIDMYNNVNASNNRSYAFNGGAKHRFGSLNIDWNGYYSRADTDPDPEDNYSISYSTRGLGMNIFNLTGNATGQLVQTNHDGDGLITPDDPRSYQNVANYDRLTLGQNFNYASDEKLGAKFNVNFPLALRMPFTSYVLPIDVKFGGSYAEQSRHTNKYWRSRAMTGGGSEPSWTTAQPALGQFSDPYFKNSWGFDVPIPTWVSPYLVNDFYEANPDAFYVRDTDANRGHMQTYQEMVAERQTTESTTAAYAELSFRPIPTLTIMAGLRYEVLHTEGSTPEFLGFRSYANVDGTAITSSDYDIYSTTNALSQRNPSRAKNQIAVRDPVTHEFIRFDEEDNPYYGMYDIVDQTKALFSQKPFSHTFDGEYFPNLQFKWTTPIRNLTIRGARTNSVGRPRLSQILADKEYNQSNRRVASGNPELKPQKSEKYDLSIDFTTSRDGEIRLSFFRQNIKDYIHEETTYFEVTDLIELANDLDVFYYDDLRYFPVLMRTGIWTSVNYYNSGKGKNEGFEISYRQRLDIIHKSLRNFSFYGAYSYANPTVQAYRHTMRAPTTITATTVAEYKSSPMEWVTIPTPRIQKRSATAQLSYTGRKFSGRIAAFWVDKFPYGINADILEITNQNSYLKFDLNLTYKISSRWTANFDWRNMTDVGDDRKIFDRTAGYFTSGMVMNVSVRANF